MNPTFFKAINLITKHFGKEVKQPTNLRHAKTCGQGREERKGIIISLKWAEMPEVQTGATHLWYVIRGLKHEHSLRSLCSTLRRQQEVGWDVGRLLALTTSGTIALSKGVQGSSPRTLTSSLCGRASCVSSCPSGSHRERSPRSNHSLGVGCMETAVGCGARS